jgi:hypothetical protein
MTYLDVINEVLVRLRESTVSAWSGDLLSSTTASSYTKLIGSLVNDAKRDVETFHDWLILRATQDVTTVAGTDSYSLSSGQEIKVLDVINQSTGHHLIQVSREYLNNVRYPSVSTGEPQYYGFNGVDASNNLKVELSPQPTEAQVISFDLVKFQAELTSATTVLSVPEKPVILGTWARAIAERGEDGGTQASIVAVEYQNSLNKAISVDSGMTDYENDWFVKGRDL